LSNFFCFHYCNSDLFEYFKQNETNQASDEQKRKSDQSENELKERSIPRELESINYGSYALFNVIFSKISFQNKDNRLGICFMFDDTYDVINLNMQNSYMNFDENYYCCQTNVFFPSFLQKFNKKIVYFYYITDMNKIVFENDLILSNKPRKFELLDKMCKNMAVNFAKNYYQFDGIALFHYDILIHSIKRTV
jgi:hypothetical protein